MSFEPIAVRVRRGAALLDQVRPGWAREIAAGRLAMDSCSRCVLGQLYGDYQRGLVDLTPPPPADRRFSMSHGFILSMAEYRSRLAAHMDQLDQCWWAEIAARAAEGGSS